jgi:hypothetical protein
MERSARSGRQVDVGVRRLFECRDGNRRVRRLWRNSDVWRAVKFEVRTAAGHRRPRWPRMKTSKSNLAHRLTPHERREALRRTGARNPFSRSPHRLTSATARFPGFAAYILCSRTSSNGAAVKVFRSTTPAAKARPNRRPVSVSLDGPAPVQHRYFRLI